jgi:hypothetical protein
MNTTSPFSSPIPIAIVSSPGSDRSSPPATFPASSTPYHDNKPARSTIVGKKRPAQEESSDTSTEEEYGDIEGEDNKTSEPKKTVSFKNDNNKVFKFVVDGLKPLVELDGKKRRYFKCKDWKTCPARYHEEENGDAPPVYYNGDHNHYPPEHNPPPLRKDIKEQVRRDLAGGIPRSLVLKRCVNESSSMSSDEIPTDNQLRNIKHRDAKKKQSKKKEKTLLCVSVCE